MLQLVTSRYNDRHWRKKIEKTLSLTPDGIEDGKQRQMFLYLKHGLKAYKSRRADPDSWIVGGYATQEVIPRAKFDPTVIAPDVTKADVAFLGEDPGADVTEAWWDDMLVQWFEQPEAEASPEAGEADEGENEKDRAEDLKKS
jgi:hypothetical protein